MAQIKDSSMASGIERRMESVTSAMAARTENKRAGVFSSILHSADQLSPVCGVSPWSTRSAATVAHRTGNPLG